MQRIDLERSGWHNKRRQRRRVITAAAVHIDTAWASHSYSGMDDAPDSPFALAAPSLMGAIAVIVVDSVRLGNVVQRAVTSPTSPLRRRWATPQQLRKAVRALRSLLLKRAQRARIAREH